MKSAEPPFGTLIPHRRHLYFDGNNIAGGRVAYDWNVRHLIASCTKSFTSALVSLAVDSGRLSVGERLYDFFPEYRHLDWSGGKQHIAIRDVLTMSAGLEWNEADLPLRDPENKHEQMIHSNDIVGFVLGQPMAEPPGTVYEYNTGLSILLGLVVERSVETPIEAFCETALFDPLGIGDYVWERLHGGLAHTGGGL